MSTTAAAPSTIENFISRWKASERANYQLFQSELCDLLNVEKPKPASATLHEAAYTFERPVLLDDGEGKNDLFRPLLFGRVKSYHFTVYNRWGQVIYQTTELQKGWSGKVAGVQQQSDAYVWVCTYQFEGIKPKTEKGTVMLVR